MCVYESPHAPLHVASGLAKRPGHCSRGPWPLFCSNQLPISGPPWSSELVRRPQLTVSMGAVFYIKTHWATGFWPPPGSRASVLRACAVHRAPEEWGALRWEGPVTVQGFLVHSGHTCRAQRPLVTSALSRLSCRPVPPGYVCDPMTTSSRRGSKNQAQNPFS